MGDKKVGDRKDPPAATGGVTCVIDFGRHSRERIRRLRRGEGRLLLDLEEVVDGLKQEGVLTPGADTVVVVVREETGLGAFFAADEDDRDEDDLDEDDGDDEDDDD